MAAYLKYENKLVTCPYDEAHKVKDSRLQIHIAKCKLNHLDTTLETCPFNATHLFNRSERDFHLLSCPDKAPLDRQLAQTMDRNNPFKGRTAVPSYSPSPIIHSDENWDDDVSAVGPGYVPQAPPPGAIIEPRPMAKPAERRRLYKELHRIKVEESEKQKDPPQTTKSTPCRQPNQHSEVEKKNNVHQQQQNMQAIQNLGLGRGKPPTRIAANIFDGPEAANNISQNEAHVSNVVNGMSNLGLGRGQTAGRGYIAALDNDDEFPALGCGRGAFRTSKQNPRVPGAKPKN